MFLNLRLTKNKGLEVVLNWKDEMNYWWSLDTSFRTQGDHAGLTFYLSVGRIQFEFNVTDRRHWNYEENRWWGWGEDFEKYKEQKDEEHSKIIESLVNDMKD